MNPRLPVTARRWQPGVRERHRKRVRVRMLRARRRYFRTGRKP